MIDRKSSTPLYIQLSDLIRKKISSGEIKPGDKLISEAEMIEKYKLGRLTIRESLSILVNEGLLEKHHGKGTFCISTPSDRTGFNFDLLLDASDIYFIPYYIRSICKVFENENCNVTISDTNDDEATICYLINKICKNGSDGIIIQPSSSITDDSEQILSSFSLLDQKNIPYILLDGTYDNVTSSYVVLDEYKAGEIAANYFLQKGHTDLCMISESNRKDIALREMGFRNSVNVKPYILQRGPGLKDELAVLLNAHSEITGIFCYNDLAAKECFELLSSLNYKIPDDISVISMDDTVIATTLNPPLTSVSHPKNRMGKDAANALLNMKKDNITWPYQKTFHSTIIERNSVKNNCKH